MKLAVVAEINFFDNELLQRVVKVHDDATWKDAYLEYLSTKEDYDNDYKLWVQNLPDDLECAKQDISDGEMDVCVTFIE